MHVTVLIPTHDNGPVIGEAIASVQAQTLSDWELMVVADGAPPETLSVVRALAESDRRIRLFEFPKGERHGEASRHLALAEATGEAVCYLGDDDLWLPDHLETMVPMLATHDFAHTRSARMDRYCAVYAKSDRIEKRAVRERMSVGRYNTTSPSVVGHRMDAYRRLPEGWAPAPPDVPTDLHMWRKWIAADVRFTSSERITLLKFKHSRRRDRTMEEALTEAAFWRKLFEDPAMWEALRQLVPDDDTSLALVDVLNHARRAKEPGNGLSGVFARLRRLLD